MDPFYFNHFATVGANSISIYALEPKGRMRPVLVFRDTSPVEMYYAVCWSCDPVDGRPWLCAAGKGGVVRLIDVTTGQLIRTLVGHGLDINDVQRHPVHPQIIVTASKDESVRLWSLTTGACLAIFAGDGGHQDQVLTCDISLDGARLVTGGIDHTVRIWDLTPLAALLRTHATGNVGSAPADDGDAEMPPVLPSPLGLAKSNLASTPLPATDAGGGRPGSPPSGVVAAPTALDPPSDSDPASSLCWTAGYPVLPVPAATPSAAAAAAAAHPLLPIMQHNAVFVTQFLHLNYVDCVRWHGDCLLSKSTHEEIALWQPVQRHGQVRQRDWVWPV